MTRIITFMALSVWLAFGLAFKLVNDATNVASKPAPRQVSAPVVVVPATSEMIASVR